MDDTAERNERWYEAIWTRSSKRKYERRLIEEEKLDRISSLIEELNGEQDSCRIHLIRQHDGSAFSGIGGSYGAIGGAPSLLVFLVKESAPDGYAGLGYRGEAVVLEAVSEGLGTCWVSGMFSSEAVARSIEKEEDERIFAVSPLGYSGDRKAFSDRMISGLAGSRRRKPLEQLVDGNVNRWPEWARSAAEAARHAPSAMNRQPWRFRYEGERLSIEPAGSASRNESRRLDCGIALRHLEVGARHVLGASVEVEFVSPPEVAAIRPA
jgi:nitroreductase